MGAQQALHRGTRACCRALSASCLHLPLSVCRTKRGAKPKTWKVGDIVTYKPSRCGTQGSGLAPKRVVCKVVGKKGRGAVVYYQLRCNEGVLETWPRACELEQAVPKSAATLTFSGVETEGEPTVSTTALARRGLAKSCRCKKQCGPNCSCKKRGAACSRKCGCKCKKGANCGNH